MRPMRAQLPRRKGRADKFVVGFLHREGTEHGFAERRQHGVVRRNRRDRRHNRYSSDTAGPH